MGDNDVIECIVFLLVGSLLTISRVHLFKIGSRGGKNSQTMYTVIIRMRTIKSVIEL